MTERQAGPSTSLRMDWVLAALSVWLIGGFYIDLWAHAHGKVDDTFFTPWHAFLYLGAASFVLVLGGLAVFGRPRRVSVREVLPAPYAMALAGGILFGIGGVLDLAWHTLFGFEVDVEALLSPTHLLLAASGLLMLGGPLRSASARIRSAGPKAPSWQLAGPFVIPLAMASAVLIAFTQYASPIVDSWSSALDSTSPEPVAQVFAMAPDGTGQTRLSRLDEDARGARLSPDGSAIVYAVQGRDGKQGEIHVMRADGTADRALVLEGDNFNPAWSPDGSRIVFAGSRGGEPDIFVMEADGSGVRQLTDDAASDWAPTWSPDGSAVAFISNRSGTFDIYRLDPAGGVATPVTTGPADDYDPAWSPDGRQIAFTSNRSGDYAVWVAAADGAAEPAIVPTGEGNAYMPSWSPDGTRLAFSSSRTGDFEVFVGALAGGEPENLSRNPGTDDGWAGPAWSPDGSLILYPSQASAPYWQNPYVRQGFGAAGVLISAAVLAGIISFARRRGPLPFGAFTVLVAVPAVMATVLRDEYRFVPSAIAAGLLADLVARTWPPGRSRVRDAVAAFLVPATFFATYFAAVALTTGIGWSIHLWLGAIVIAGVIGLLVDELAHAAVPEAAVATAEGGAGPA
jgi:Tol biopolymer transport system component